MRAAKNLNCQAGLIPERRAFFNRFVGNGDSGASSCRKLLPADRIALLKEMAARWDGRLPADAVPELQVGAACSHHAVCVAVCPTAALRGYSSDGHAGLEFDAASCIGCGICVIVCPEEALTLQARAADDGSPAATQSISRHALRACARCDDEFAVRGDEELCPACRKDVGLFTTGFSARSDET